MIAVATNIYDFTNWLKYGIRTISSDMLIDLNDEMQHIETLLFKVGMFEEDYEVFFCVIEDSVLKVKEPIFPVFIHHIVAIKSLTESAVPVLKQKLGEYKVDGSINKLMYDNLHYEKLKRISYDGLTYMEESFSLPKHSKNEKFIQTLFNVKSDLFLNRRNEKESWFDFLMTYERSKPYPVADIGFLYDVGAIYRERFHISDEDITRRDMLKSEDPNKYELISHIAELSKFLKSANQDSPFSSFLDFYNKSDLIKVFNEELQQEEMPSHLNNILLYAFFFKFRKLIRDTHDLTDYKFISQVQKFIKGSKEETIICLQMCGLMFGSLKLRELFYSSKLLTIAAELSFIEVPPLAKPKNKSQKKLAPIISQPVDNANSIAEDFNEDLLFRISVVIGNLGMPLQNKINKAFDAALHPKVQLTTDKKTYFINYLQKIASDKKNERSKNKLTKEIIEKLREVIYKVD